MGSASRPVVLQHETGFPGGAGGKGPACQCRRRKRGRVNPRLGTIPLRRAWQPTPVFLPGKFQEQRRLADYSPWSREARDTNEHIQPHRRPRGRPVKRQTAEPHSGVSLGRSGERPTLYIPNSLPADGPPEQTLRTTDGAFCCCSVAKACLTLATPRTVPCQAPLSMGFSRQEYWSELPFPSPDLE